MRGRGRRLTVSQARSDDVGQLRQAFRVTEVAAEPAREDLGNVRERPPLEHGYVFDDARRSKARHRRAGGAPGLVEPAPTLLVERHERLAEQRSEEHTSELQSPCNLVCRLLLEKKKDDRPTKHTA